MNIKSQALMGALIVLGALDGDINIRVPRKYLSRTSCADCGCDIPPGRPGRKCPDCRGDCRKPPAPS
jgi:hypothetical protein